MRLRLRVTPPSGPGFDFVADHPVVRIGRDPAGDLCFAESQDNVSWEHATITVSDRAATLADQDSTNGTFLNNSPTTLKTVALKVGDEFRLGKTGPVLRVLDLELNTAPIPVPPKPKPTAPRPPVARPAGPPARSGGPTLEVSATRKLLLETQSKNRSLASILVGVFLALLLLIAVAIWLLDLRGRTLDQRVDDVKKDVKQVDARIDETNKQLAGLAQDVKGLAATFEETNRRNEAIRNEDAKKLEIIAADARRNHDQLVEELKKKPPAQQPVADLAALNQVRGAIARRVEPEEPPLGLKPGLILSIRRRGSANLRGVDYENIALVAATPDTLHIESLDPTRPKKIPVDEIETVFVKNQMYTFNESSKQFEHGLNYFRLDKATGQFVRVGRQEIDLSGAERGETQGEIVTQCFLNRSSGFVLVLPKSKFNSINFEAGVIAQITTNFGTHTWVESERQYRFKTHQQIAKELQEEYEKRKKEADAEEWKKKVERYKLVTDRLRELRPYWWRGW